ncbi:uncharacterized protein [Rutidosis leptorrhynchoides]|uniref:uncharacterized protein n=1 Tax=Rutidosis leptorrhynchoides TaxID=125765 RepID=UPI003A99F72E
MGQCCVWFICISLFDRFAFFRIKTRRRTSNGERNNDDEITARIQTAVKERMSALREEFEKGFLKPRGNGEKEFSYKNFRVTKPSMYYGDPDPLVSTGWISDVEGCFRTSECPLDKKKRLATSLLQGSARNWLDGKIDIVGEEPFMRLSWDDSKKEFFEEFRTQADLTRIHDELRSLRRSSMDLNTLRATFLSKAQFCPEYTDNGRLLMEDFRNTLNDDLPRKISIGQVDSFAKLFSVAKGFESYTSTRVGDTSGERRVKLYGAPSKKARSAIESTGSGRKGVSDTSASRCFNCGERGHEC